MRGMTFVGGAALGAGVMFLLDPSMGKRRLSLIRDQVVSAGARSSRFIRGRSEDLKNRAYGLFCETKALFGTHCGAEGSFEHRRAS